MRSTQAKGHRAGEPSPVPDRVVRLLSARSSRRGPRPDGSGGGGSPALGLTDGRSRALGLTDGRSRALGLTDGRSRALGLTVDGGVSGR
ncbi:hypothetical protein [Streptomyces sp. NPDC001292]|uniref:hypothetical protein n=1 Tax=Streptomyces sp. NPDC001292 TaxID=3364558 RepID=UPI0036A4EDFB